MLDSHHPKTGQSMLGKVVVFSNTHTWVKGAVEIHPVGSGVIAIRKLNCSHLTNHYSAGIDESLECGAGGIARRI